MLCCLLVFRIEANYECMLGACEALLQQGCVADAATCSGLSQQQLQPVFAEQVCHGPSEKLFGDDEGEEEPEETCWLHDDSVQLAGELVRIA